MKTQVQPSIPELSTRDALRRRVKQFYRHFNEEDWNHCHSLVDPELASRKVGREAYSEQLRAFKEVYGAINVWYTRISMHATPAPTQRDKRAFAYVYVIWQDASHGYHMFRDRWIMDDGNWYTRVVGLVPNVQKSVAIEV